MSTIANIRKALDHGNDAAVLASVQLLLDDLEIANATIERAKSALTAIRDAIVAQVDTLTDTDIEALTFVLNLTDRIEKLEPMVW